MSPLTAAQDLGIRIRLRMLIILGIVGLLLFAAMAFMTIVEIRAGSPAFAQNRVAYEVNRDFVHPSQALADAEMFYRLCRAAHGRADVERVEEMLRQSHAALEAGHRHYMEVMPPGHLRDLVTIDSYQSAEQWYVFAETEYMPHIERGDLDGAENVRLDKLDPLVQRNFAVSEEIGKLADQWIVSSSEYVKRAVRSRIWFLAAIGLALLVAQFLLGMVIYQRVGLSVRQLHATMEELQRKNTEVEGFVYVVSHDLKAPLVNIQGFTRELQESFKNLRESIQACPSSECCWANIQALLDVEMGDALHFISASASKFEHLINALLDLSRYGRQVYNLTRVNVWKLATNAVDTFQQEMTAAGAEVEVGQLPSVTADATALGQVFSNLIDNALKYRSSERRLRAEVGGKIEGNVVHYWVRDNGLGIPEYGMSRLFQVFQRLNPSQASGEGMGLAIAHRIVERHGGKIWAESREGEGSTFHFSVPCNSVRGEEIVGMKAG